MNLEAGSVIYKSVDQNYYKQGEEFDTSFYNYGMAVTHRSGRERAEFDQFMRESKVTGKKLGEYLRPALPRLKSALEGSRYGAAFREHLIERVRADVCPTAPRRRESVFSGLKKSDVEKFQGIGDREHHVLVTLEVIQCDAAFLGDMAVLDEFEVFDHDYNQAQSIVQRYWLQQHSQNPCLELLVQGRFKWGKPA